MPVLPSTPFQFGVITDLHCGSRNVGDRFCNESLDKLAFAVETFNRLQVKYVFDLGDAVNETEKAASLAQLSAVTMRVAGFRGEWISVLGNHDLDPLNRAEFFEVRQISRESSFFSMDRDGVHLVVLDANFKGDGTPYERGAFTWIDSFVPPEQVQWLQQDLAQAGDRATIIFCHELLYPHFLNGMADPHSVGNADQMKAVIEKAGNVRAVCQGHFHYGRFLYEANCAWLTFRAAVLGSGLDHASFAVVTLFPDGKIEVQGFGSQASVTIVP